MINSSEHILNYTYLPGTSIASHRIFRKHWARTRNAEDNSGIFRHPFAALINRLPLGVLMSLLYAPEVMKSTLNSSHLMVENVQKIKGGGYLHAWKAARRRKQSGSWGGGRPTQICKPRSHVCHCHRLGSRTSRSLGNPLKLDWNGESWNANFLEFSNKLILSKAREGPRFAYISLISHFKLKMYLEKSNKLFGKTAKLF